MSGFVTSSRYTWLEHSPYGVKHKIINRSSIPVASNCTSHAQNIQQGTFPQTIIIRGCCTYPTTVRSRGTGVGWNLQILFSLVMQLIFPLVLLYIHTSIWSIESLSLLLMLRWIKQPEYFPYSFIPLLIPWFVFEN